MIRWFHQCHLCPLVIVKPDQWHAEQAVKTHGRKAHKGMAYEYQIERQESETHEKA